MPTLEESARVAFHPEVTHTQGHAVFVSPDVRLTLNYLISRQQLPKKIDSGALRLMRDLGYAVIERGYGVKTKAMLDVVDRTSRRLARINLRKMSEGDTAEANRFFTAGVTHYFSNGTYVASFVWTDEERNRLLTPYFEQVIGRERDGLGQELQGFLNTTVADVQHRYGTTPLNVFTSSAIDLPDRMPPSGFPPLHDLSLDKRVKALLKEAAPKQRQIIRRCLGNYLD